MDVYFPGKRGEARVSYCFVTFDGWQAAERASKETECVIDGEVSCPDCISMSSICRQAHFAVHVTI